MTAEPHPNCLYRVVRFDKDSDTELAPKGTLKDVTLSVREDARAEGLTLPETVKWQGHMNEEREICFYLATIGPLEYLAIPQH